MAALASASARADGPYLVDNWDITPAGRAQIESWMSLAADGWIVNMIPATSLASLPALEWSVALTRSIVNGQPSTSLSPQTKWKVGDPGRRSWGFALAGGPVIDGRSGRVSSLLAYAAATRPIGNGAMHVNVGWSRALDTGAASALIWGARAEQPIGARGPVVHAELADLGTGVAGQAGLRRPLKGGRIDLELIAGHNLAGERRLWATMGASVRF